MKNLNFYPDFKDYKESIFNMFQDKDLAEHPFYKNLILFICDNISPTYYDISDPDEHFAFSGAYHFMTRRMYENKEGSKTRQSIFFLHDFSHLLFPYHHSVEGVSVEDFTNAFVYQERIASTETEIMSYNRVPGLRSKVFSDERILFDVLDEKPDPVEFLAHRNRIIMDDAYGQQHLGEWPELLAWMQSWRRLTPKWCQKRYDSMLDKSVPQFDWPKLTVENYESTIADYIHIPSQQRYEQNILQNIAIAFALLDWPDAPTDFASAGEAFAKLEGQVLVR